MKKVFIVIAALSTFTFSYTNASIISDQSSSTAVILRLNQDQEKEISFHQLPEDVRIAFEESDFALWEVKKIIEITPNQNPENSTYRITVSNGNEELEITLDQDGNIVG